MIQYMKPHSNDPIETMSLKEIGSILFHKGVNIVEYAK